MKITAPQRIGQAPGRAGLVDNHNTSTIAPNCSTAHGSTLPERNHTAMHNGPSANVPKPSKSPERALTRPAATNCYNITIG